MNRFHPPISCELIESQDKRFLTHARNGVKVSCFEVLGQRQSGKPLVLAFAGDKSGFHAMQAITLANVIRRARLVTGEIVPINLPQR